MKFIFLALSSWCAIAQAFPNIGDEVRYEGCTPSQSGCLHFVREQQLVSRDAATDTFGMNVRLWEQGSGPQYKTVTVAAKDLATSQDVQDLFGRCKGSDARFTYEMTEITVPAGKFIACKVYTSETGATSYVADVPFGVIKTEGSAQNFELMAYKVGTP